MPFEMVSGTAWMLWSCQLGKYLPGPCPVLLSETLSSVALDLLWTWASVCSDCMESLKITRARVEMTKNAGVCPFFLFLDRLICICCSEQLYALGSSAWIFFQSISAGIQIMILAVRSDLGGGFRSLTWTTSQFASAPFFSLHLLLTHKTPFSRVCHQCLVTSSVADLGRVCGAPAVISLAACWAQKPAASLTRRVVFLPAGQCSISWFQLKWDSAGYSVSLCLGCCLCSSPQHSRVVFFFPANLQMTLTPQ